MTRTLWGATQAELTELLHDLDTRVATAYEATRTDANGSERSGTEAVR